MGGYLHCTDKKEFLVNPSLKAKKKKNGYDPLKNSDK